MRVSGTRTVPGAASSVRCDRTGAVVVCVETVRALSDSSPFTKPAVTSHTFITQMKFILAVLKEPMPP